MANVMKKTIGKHSSKDEKAFLSKENTAKEEVVVENKI